MIEMNVLTEWIERSDGMKGNTVIEVIPTKEGNEWTEFEMRGA